MLSDSYSPVEGSAAHCVEIYVSDVLGGTMVTLKNRDLEGVEPALGLKLVRLAIVFERMRDSTLGTRVRMNQLSCSDWKR